MPTLIIDNVPISLFDQILDLAKTQRRTPADTALEVLADAFRKPQPRFADAPLPSLPFLTEEIVAPCSIPWPKGEAVVPIEVAEPLPQPHDLAIAE